jgi:hypothetical protein
MVIGQLRLTTQLIKQGLILLELTSDLLKWFPDFTKA